jgi:membrane protease YdiL (CAAX protease family)
VAIGLTIVVSAFDPSIPGDPHSSELLAYEATMPGLDEELFFRGLLLALLCDVFPRTRSVLGAALGWPTVVTSMLFVWGHVFHVDVNLRPRVETELLPVASLLGFGVLMAWIRARTGSVWWAVAAHNIANVALVLCARLRA